MRTGRYITPPFQDRIPRNGGNRTSYWEFQEVFRPWINALPEGTFSAANFLRGLGGEAKTIIWNINVYSLNATESCAQIEYIASLPGQREPGVLLELGNEFYLRGQGLPRFPDGDSYGAAMAPIVACARRLLPHAKIAAVGAVGREAT